MNASDPRFDVDAHANSYYSLRCTLEGVAEEQGLYGIIDEEAGGYIAFTTDQEVADRIASALEASS